MDGGSRDIVEVMRDGSGCQAATGDEDHRMERGAGNW